MYAKTFPDITAEIFFDSWKKACTIQRDLLLRTWSQSREYTLEVLEKPGAVLDVVAADLGLKVYAGYYSIDAIFHTADDEVHCTPTGQRWVQNIRIAFEHENSFGSGLFKEASHLLITRAALRVLVAYPGNDDEHAYELRNLARIIAEAGFGDTSPDFLFITGRRLPNNADIGWEARTYQHGDWVMLG